MIKRRFTLCLLCFILCILMIVTSAHALALGFYLPRNSAVYLSWDLEGLKTSSTTYLSNNSAVQTELSNAIGIWSDARDPNNDSMITLGLTTSGNTNFTIIAGDINHSFTGYIGYMTPYYGLTGTNEIQGGTIELDTSVYWGVWPISSQYDIGTIVAHETGHLLGIAHCHETGTCTSPTCKSNVMYPSTAPGVTRMTLTAYDLASYQLIYYANYYGYFPEE